MVMMFIDESVCNRVLGDEVFGYCYISCLNLCIALYPGSFPVYVERSMGTRLTYVKMSYLIVTF